MTRIQAVLLLFLLAPGAAAAQEYFPPPGEWETRTAAELGIDAEQLDAAVRFAIERESTAPRDLAMAHQSGFGREPLGDAVGPLAVRGGLTGVIIHRGYVVAQWGDPYRVEPTFSVAKSFLSATVGLAWDRGLIPDIHEPVARRMGPVQVERPECVAPLSPHRDFPAPTPLFEPFASEHASRITWDHLLRQTSDWEGTLWCKPDWADRPASNPADWGTRERFEPGTVYEYNDVRVNLLALAALNVWRTPLPRVLREHVMDPIGASPTWRWYGYENSWVVIDGERMSSVSGGTHWGGGMFISAFDLARFGYLHLRDGRWEDRTILSSEWLEQARTPGEVNASYGFMNFFLNPGRRALSNTPESAYRHVGAGSNIVYVDPEHDLVVVVRWIQGGALNEFLGQVIDAVTP